MKYQIEHELRFLGDLSMLDERTDEIYEALLVMPDAQDPDLTATLATGEVAIAMVVEATDALDATAKAVCLLRTALHQAGSGTPGWEDVVRALQASSRAVDLADAY